MDSILKYSMVVSLSLFLSGCMGMMMGMGNMSGMMGGIGSNSNEVELSNTKKEDKSYIIVKRYCTQCHEMKDTTLHSKKDWDRTISRMLGYMKQQNKLQPDEYELVMIEHYYDSDKFISQTPHNK